MMIDMIGLQCYQVSINMIFFWANEEMFCILNRKYWYASQHKLQLNDFICIFKHMQTLIKGVRVNINNNKYFRN